MTTDFDRVGFFMPTTVEEINHTWTDLDYVGVTPDIDGILVGKLDAWPFGHTTPPKPHPAPQPAHATRVDNSRDLLTIARKVALHRGNTERAAEIAKSLHDLPAH